MNNDLEQFSEEYLKELINSSADDLTIALARIALAAKQAKPVAFTSMRWLETRDKVEAYTAEDLFDEKYAKHGMKSVPLYTTPQPAHTEQDDTRRMNWLVSQNVEVRIPMLYGSHARFVAQCDSDDCEEYHTTLREQIDAAMLAATPKLDSE